MTSGQQEVVHRIQLPYRLQFVIMGFFYFAGLVGLLSQPGWEVLLYFAVLVVMTFLIGRFYVLKLRISDAFIEFQYLTHRIRLTRNDIDSIKNAYIWLYMYPTPSVEIAARNRKRPIRLFEMDIKAADLKRRLDHWHAG